MRDNRYGIMNKYISHTNKKLLLTLVVIMSALISGCKTDSDMTEEISVSVDEYSRKIHEKTQVQVGDISPVFTVDIKEDGYSVSSYGGLEETLEVAELLVEEGSYVKKGDVLIRFKETNDDIEKLRKEYISRIDEDKLLIEHLERLAILDPDSNYYTDKLLMENDIKLMSDKIEELDRKKERLIYRATDDGIVEFISKELLRGYAPKSETLIRTVSGTNMYIATTDEDFQFEIGSTYDAVYGLATVKMEIVDVSEKNGLKKVVFKPLEKQNVLSTSEEYHVTIEKEIMPNSVYVDSKAIRSVGKDDYVYILNDEGIMIAKQVKVKCVTGDNSIIEEGLQGGEWVALD